MSDKVELYRHPKQKEHRGWVRIPQLEEHLEEEGIIGRCDSIEDARIKGWMDSPDNYPLELRKLKVVLWGSRGRSGIGQWVMVLHYHEEHDHDGNVVVSRLLALKYLFCNALDYRHPALIHLE